ncbi:unnamed protein product, partial [marine sediment metagenome]
MDFCSYPPALLVDFFATEARRRISHKKAQKAQKKLDADFADYAEKYSHRGHRGLRELAGLVYSA